MSHERSLGDKIKDTAENVKEKIFGKSREDYEVAADKAQAFSHKAAHKADEAQDLANAKIHEYSDEANEVRGQATQKIDELRRKGNAASKKANEVKNLTGEHLEEAGENLIAH
ncbi:unnamed protein product [Bursaphelenchus xylophilus]|uniref:(pine wood nematode) hypothetical protein n=1 Tax=Bursaphelenchus xylophilus TaxID=6326 RepID=A0A1I7RX83_BURXY|nr:unnamed protein product [Bursaphelenchus xylophilus]CAG9121416.1 unnamed protein product [Bursaphelenchus xylophilus]